jgi:hypothetical protein
MHVFKYMWEQAADILMICHPELGNIAIDEYGIDATLSMCLVEYRKRSRD